MQSAVWCACCQSSSAAAQVVIAVDRAIITVGLAFLIAHFVLKLMKVGFCWRAIADAASRVDAMCCVLPCFHVLCPALTVQDDGWFIRSPTIYIINVCCGSVLLTVALAAVAAFGRRMVRAKLSGKRWWA